MPQHPETFNVPIELALPNGKMMVADLGIMFKPVQFSAGSWGYVPAIIYFNNAITGQKYRSEDAVEFIDAETLRGAVQSLRWLAWYDDEIDPESRELINLAAGEFGKD